MRVKAMTAEFKHKLILYAVIGGLILIIFLQKSCSGKSTQTVTVKTPEKTGEIKKPSAIIHHKTKGETFHYKEKTIYTENPINKKMANELADALQANDSLKVLKMYLTAIEEREQTQTFNNKDLTVDVWTKTRGEVLDMKIDYKIKPQEIKVQVPVKSTVFAVYAGGGLETTTTLDKLTPKVNLGTQNRRGDILSLSYGLDKSIGLSYSFRIINYKK